MKIEGKETKLSLWSLVIETTRKCNLACAHCLRGASQEQPNLLNYQGLLKDVAAVSCITFTGGEPDTPEGIKVMGDVLNACKENGINVHSFYVVTNGVRASSEFLHMCLDWYLYTIHGYMDDIGSGVALSQDKYHSRQHKDADLRLQAFSFFRPRDKQMDADSTLLSEGFAWDLNAKTRPVHLILPDRFEITGEALAEVQESQGQQMLAVEDFDIYICIDGEVRVNCDLSYVNTSDTLGSVLCRPLAELLWDYADKGFPKQRALYDQIKVHDFKQPLCLADGSTITREFYETEEDKRYNGQGIDFVWKITLADKDKQVLGSYSTMDTDDNDHVVRLACCLIRDYKKSIK